MRRRRVLVAALIAATAVAVLLFGGALSGPSRANPLAILQANAGVTPEQERLGKLFEGFSTGDPARVVRSLETRVARAPSDGDALVVLGLAYQQRARESADPTYYRLSQTALDRAAAAGGPPSLVAQGRAALANT